VPDRPAQALHAPVGVHDRPLLLGVGLRREDDGRVLAQALGQELRVRDDGGRLLEGRDPRAAPGQVADGVGAQQVERAQLARGGGRGDAGGVTPRGLDRRVAGAGVGQDAGLAQPAPVGR
jgi:hypothetical protein